jgi:dTDP-4-dehydrorhamnose reductase
VNGCVVKNRVLLTGASGHLGGYLLRQLVRTGVEVVAWSGSQATQLDGVGIEPVDLKDADRVAAAFRAARPQALIHAAAMAGVANCQRNPERAAAVNARGTARLTELAAQSATRFVYVSTDLVFDGEQGTAYRETDRPAPLSIYGRTKVEAEQLAQAIPRSVVVRVSLLYGPSLFGRPSFFDQQLCALRAGQTLTLFDDEWRTPLDLVTAARALVSIAPSDYTGLLHVGGPQRLSRLEMGQRLANALRADPSCIRAVSRHSVAAGEPRPRDTSLDSSLWRAAFPGLPWPSAEDALEAMLRTARR